MPLQTRKPFIFIVFRTFEHALALSLKNVLEEWGYDVFQFAQDHRDGEAFRKEIRGNIRKCDLALLLLSREFQWSAHCQAEVGAVIALEKPYIPILVPPVSNEDNSGIAEIAPILDGCVFLSADEPDFLSRLQSKIATKLAEGKENLQNLISELQRMQEIDLGTFAIKSVQEEGKKRAEVRDAVKSIEEQYGLYQPKKRLSNVWSSLGDPACQASIVGNIKRSFDNPRGTTTLTFVGVSLKYSLSLITEALQALSSGTKRACREGGKKLAIQIVHMDDQSHILHALRDALDMAAIQKNFGEKWLETKKLWTDLCLSEDKVTCDIELAEPISYRIDYIPPRVGIRIETESETLLYAGRCAFNQIGPLPIFKLDVGENEYLFFHKNTKKKDAPSVNTMNERAFNEFQASFNAYQQPQNNSGVTPIWTSSVWLQRLELYIEKLKEPAEVTFISGTATKFEGLIVRALEKGAAVRTYVHDSGTTPEVAKALYARLRNEIGETATKAEQHRYQHPATFRGVVINDTAIGLQVYIRADANLGPRAKKIPLCFIITPCFSNFQELQRQMLAFAEGDSLSSDVFNFA